MSGDSAKRPAAERRGQTANRATPVRRLARILVLIGAAVVVANALVGDQGLLAIMWARQEYDALAASIARQRADTARLREEARRLRDDPAAIEAIARRDLGLIRPGETVFIVKDLPR